MHRLARLSGHLRPQSEARGPGAGPGVAAAPTSAKELSWTELYQLDTLGFLKVENCIDLPTIREAWARTERVIEQFGQGAEPLSIWQDAHYGEYVQQLSGFFLAFSRDYRKVAVTVMVLRSKYRNAFLYDTLLQRLATDPRILGCE